MGLHGPRSSRIRVKSDVSVSRVSCIARPRERTPVSADGTFHCTQYCYLFSIDFNMPKPRAAPASSTRNAPANKNDEQNIVDIIASRCDPYSDDPVVVNYSYPISETENPPFPATTTAR